MDNLESLDVDTNFEPQTRARSNTWPLPRPEYYVDKDDEEKVAVPATIQEQETGGGASAAALPGGGGGGGVDGVGQPPKKNSSRRNAWGNKSYADLITQAIQSSPEKRLTLSQIYDWMVQNVAYFKDKGDSNSSAGWKNSIRHNLSLHNRFMRVQNEGTGKSSWWMVNPDAKPGKAARRRAVSMETPKYEKKRGRVKKKVENLRNAVEPTPCSPSSSISEGIDMFPESPVHQTFQLSPDFRPRASSNASSCSRLSPIPAIENDGQDSQVPPLSPIPWNTEPIRPRASTGGPLGTMFRPTPNHHKNGANNSVLHGSTGTLVGCDRYGADQLVDSLAEAMKLGENTFLNDRVKVGAQIASMNGNGGGYTLNGTFNRFAMRGLNGGNGTHTHDFVGSPYQTTGSARNSPNLINVQSPSGQPSPQGSSALDSGNGSFLNSLSPQHSVSPGVESMVVVQSQVSRPSSLTNVFGGSPYNDDHSPVVVDIPMSPENLMQHQHSSSTLRATLCGVGPGCSLSPSPSVSLVNTASLVGQNIMFTLNNSLPNDVDLNTIQEGLECDVDSILNHELIIDGNLEFNFADQQQNQCNPNQSNQIQESSAIVRVTASPVAHSQGSMGASHLGQGAHGQHGGGHNGPHGSHPTTSVVTRPWVH